MAKKKLTDALIRNLPAPASGRTEIWDTVITGLGIRVNMNGSKTWFVRYRANGRQRRYKLGNYPHLSLTEARRKALEAISGIQINDEDPQRQKEQKRAATKPVTVAEAVERFIKTYAKPKNRSWKETKRLLDKHFVPEFGKRPLEDMTKRELIQLLDDVCLEAPYTANALMRQMRRFFNWCVEKDLLQVSPMTGVKPPHAETSRDRVLTDDEVRTVWQACEEMPYPFGPLFQLLLLTGQRRGEVASMRWEHIDKDMALWTLPRELTKSDRAHEVPLSQAALNILDTIPVQSSRYVFTTTNKTPVSGFTVAKRACDDLVSESRANSGQALMSNWRIHDLRRTVASGLARLGHPPHIIEKILNHSTGQITGVAAVYNRHAYTEEKREALEHWASHVDRLISSDDSGASSHLSVVSSSGRA